MSNLMSRAFLKHMRVDSFGAMRDRAVGPFGPGMNVVYGENEAGKTTLASFVTGVLFGWEEARGVRNTYKPENAERAGALIFEEDGRMREVSRVRNVDGLRGDAYLVDDVDKGTFRTMFALTSDELRSLRNAPDVVTRLLTAGSGTQNSPAQALADLQSRIAEYTSRAASVEHSVTRLGAQREQMRTELRAMGDEMEAMRDFDRELRELEPRRADLHARLGEASRRLEALAGARASVEHLEAEMDQLLAESSHLRKEKDLALEQRDDAQGRLDALSSPAGARRSGAGRLVAVVVLPIVFLLASLPLFFYGHERGEDLFLMLGAALAVGALALAVTGIVSQARWARADENARELDAAERADAAKRTAREYEALCERLDAAEARLDALDAQRARALAAVGLAGEDSLEDLEAALERATAEQQALLEESTQVNSRFGELKQLLATALGDEEFDRMKVRYQAVRTRYNDSVRELSCLLIARRMLEDAIAEWDSESRPEVYVQAGRLMSLMTDGRWTQVVATPEGEVRVGNDLGVERDPVHLSLGTCQQLYLSLRIALLMTADNVGRAVPVLADDIMVNFDASRRRGAARALAELARTRQVILFTCHQEVASVLAEADPEARIINL